MRVAVTHVLAATIGALLISVSHPALTQEHHGERQNEAGRPAAAELTEPAEMPPPAMTAEEILAALPELPVTETAEAPPPAMTAEQVLAALPERPIAETAAETPTAATAEQVLATLPERPLAETAAETPTAATAEQVLATLPERPLAETAEAPPPAMTTEQLLAALPERQLVRREEEPAPAVTAERVLAQLPERVLGGEPVQAESHEPRRQPEALKADMQEELLTVTSMPADPRWAALKEANLGTTLDLPRAVFVKSDGHAHKRVGRRYRTADGRARVAVWTQRNTRHDTPASYLRRTFAIPLATLDYERSTPEFAAVSGNYRGKVFYLRCNLSARGTFHRFDLAYPARERKAWDHVVTRMSRSLRSHDE